MIQVDLIQEAFKGDISKRFEEALKLTFIYNNDRARTRTLLNHFAGIYQPLKQQLAPYQIHAEQDIIAQLVWHAATYRIQPLVPLRARNSYTLPSAHEIVAQAQQIEAGNYTSLRHIPLAYWGDIHPDLELLSKCLPPPSLEFRDFILSLWHMYTKLDEDGSPVAG